jgi:hypothetical protein
MEATGTAGNLSGLALNGTADPAVMVATGVKLPVEPTALEFLWACAGGVAEVATVVADGGTPSFLCTGAEADAASAADV